ncbi:MAG: hypothetical protein ACI8PZ_001867 [Myxococcota bacterium]|jgi:hypothetical protein
MRGWIGLAAVFCVGCGPADSTALLAAESVPALDRALTGFELAAAEGGQCRLPSTTLTDTDNTSCGIVAGPDDGQWWDGTTLPVLSPGFSIRRLAVGGSRARVGHTSLPGDHGSLLVLDGRDLVRVDADGSEGVVATGGWTPLALERMDDDGVAVSTADAVVGIYGPL